MIRSVFKLSVFAVCLIACGFGQFTTAFEGAQRFAELPKADWLPTNAWLESAECARSRGAWLAICDGDKLVPISERSFGDDPGHALFLGVWAMVTDSRVSLADVARLNVGLRAAGFIFLASLLFAIRAYVTLAVFLVAGPTVYFAWNDVSPHWSFIGVTSLALPLPVALIAKEFGLLSRWSSNVFVAVGLLGLMIAALVREVIGVMGLVTTVGVIGCLVWHRLRCRGDVWNLLAVALLALAASAASTWATLGRDVLFEMEPAQRVATHNFSHTLYIGLGAVPNDLGLSYHDEVAFGAVERVAPDVVLCSPAYYQLLWKLYWSAIVDSPIEVMRIYFEKAKLILGDSIIEPGLPLGLVLILTLIHIAVATKHGMWWRVNFVQGLLLQGASVALIGLFVAQAILAHPTRMYATPTGSALLILLGTTLELACRYAASRLAQIRTKEAARL